MSSEGSIFQFSDAALTSGRLCVQSQERRHLTFDPRLQSLKSQLDERAGVEQLRGRREGRASVTRRRSRESAFLHADSVLCACGAEMLPHEDGFLRADTVCALISCARVLFLCVRDLTLFKRHRRVLLQFYHVT